MQANTVQRLWGTVIFRIYVSCCCLWAGVSEAADTVKNSQDIAAELDRETNLESQLDRALAPMDAVIKQTASGARRIKQRFAKGTPEYNESKGLYSRVRQGLTKLDAELTEDVKAVQPDDRGDRARRADPQLIAELNAAIQGFNELANRLIPPPPSEAPKTPAQPTPAGEPAGQPTPPGLYVQPLQPEQYPQAQQGGGVSSEVAVQVTNVFVVHTLGLSPRSVEGIRQQMIRHLQRRASLPEFDRA